MTVSRVGTEKVCGSISRKRKVKGKETTWWNENTRAAVKEKKNL